jgi:hypothetical protein
MTINTGYRVMYPSLAENWVLLTMLVSALKEHYSEPVMVLLSALLRKSSVNLDVFSLSYLDFDDQIESGLTR